MRSISEAALAAWFDRAMQRYARNTTEQFFVATISTVSGKGPYAVTVIRSGETATDGNTYMSAIPGYTPQAGDRVECMWRDPWTAYVLWPLSGLGVTTSYYARLHLANTVVIANATDTLIKCDTKDDDPNGNYSTSTGLYTAPVAGRFLVNGQMRVNTGAAGWFTVNVYRNATSGTPQYFGSSTAQSGGLNPTVGINRVIRCKAADTLGISVYQTSGGNQTLDVGSEACFFHVTYLGA